jgi:hypothetical protein
MNAGRGVLLHGEWWDVTTLDDATRREMARQIEGLAEIDVVRSSTTGPDLFDDNALIVLIVLDNFDALTHYRSQPVYQTMAQYIQPLGLYPDKMVQFNIEMPQDARSLRPQSGLVLHGCQVGVTEIDDQARSEIVDQMRNFGQLDFVRAATAGLDLLAANAISQVTFLDSAEALSKCREHEWYTAVEASIAKASLPSVAFSLQLRDAPW